MDKVVAYLLEKETITGPEMVAILEGRDPALADNYPDPDEEKEKAAPQPEEETPASQPEPASEPIPLGDGHILEENPENKNE